MPELQNLSDVNDLQVYRGQLFYFVDGANSDAFTWIRDGLLTVRNGQIESSGEYDELISQLPDGVKVHDYRNYVITPGFIDTHIHFPQTEMIASPAPGLLPWLENYTFPTEKRFADPEYSAEVAEFFLKELLRCGTTTAMVYCTVHPESAEAFFSASHALNTRMIAGKVMMDRNCPEFLQDTPQTGAKDSERLIQSWHGTGRQLYALTPRFAPTSSVEQLGLCGELAQSYQDVYIQSHVAENQDEVKWAMELFPNNRSYLDIYDSFGLLRPKAVYGHCIWLDAEDQARMRDTGTIAAHCPTSNLFLGSGLYNVLESEKAGVPVTLATDVGAGTSFSMLQTMNEANKVARLNGHYLNARHMFWLATQAAASHLGLSGKIGTLSAGAEADFIVLDPAATPLLERRSSQANTLEELLFALAILGDDRVVTKTYVAGNLVHQR